MFGEIAVRLFLGLVAVCGIIGFIGCDDFEALIIGIIDDDPIEPEDNEWTGTWVLETYQGLSALEALTEYDDYDDEDWTFLDADGSV